MINLCCMINNHIMNFQDCRKFHIPIITFKHYQSIILRAKSRRKYLFVKDLMK